MNGLKPLYQECCTAAMNSYHYSGGDGVGSKWKDLVPKIKRGLVADQILYCLADSPDVNRDELAEMATGLYKLLMEDKDFQVVRSV